MLKEEDGDVIVFFAFLMVIMIGIAGLVIDMGFFYRTKSHLKKAANAAVLSGAQEIINDSTSADNIVHDILGFHEVDDSLSNLNIVADEGNNVYKLKVGLAKDVRMSFLKLFGVNSIKATAESTAELAPMNSGSGAVPLGIDESIPLEYMQEYKLKVDSGDSTYGNFGILAYSIVYCCLCFTLNITCLGIQYISDLDFSIESILQILLIKLCTGT
jgi:hypothetical protein